MSQPSLADVARQFAVVFAAIFQVYASYVVGDSVGDLAHKYRSLIFPATYAFAIWGAIFLLCGVYAIHQALPIQRDNPVYRAIGWWTAAAFLTNGVWSYAFINRQFVLAQLIIFAGFVFAGRAFLGFAREATGARATNVEAWVVGPALGLLFGWITAANVVGLATTLVALGFAGTGQGAAIGGAALLLLGGAVAFFAILATKSGPESAWVAFGAAVLWALVAVIAEQRAASPLTTGAAILSAVLVAAALVGPWRAPLQPAGRGAAA